MRVFKFNSEYNCPICGTNEEKDCVLLPVYGTGEGNNVQALPVHLDCLADNCVIYPIEELIATRAKFVREVWQSDAEDE